MSQFHNYMILVDNVKYNCIFLSLSFNITKGQYLCYNNDEVVKYFQSKEIKRAENWKNIFKDLHMKT